MSIVYHSVEVENYKEIGYEELESCDFVLTFENRKIVAGSVRIEGDVRVTEGGANLTSEDIRIDGMIGANAFFQDYYVETQNQGSLEQLTEAPRFVRMLSDATMTKNDCFNSDKSCELRSGSDLNSRVIIRGIPNQKTTGSSLFNNDNDFSVKMPICLNHVEGDQEISYKKTGAVRLSVNLARNYAVLFGTGVTANSKYTLKNLKVCFVSVPEDNVSGEHILRTKLMIKQSLNSEFANISSKVPTTACNSCSVSFQQQDRENTQYYNNVETNEPPNVSSVQFLFQDATNKYISYEIVDRPEVLNRYIRSFMDTGDNNCSLSNLKSNKSYGCGLSFGRFINLTNQKFNLQINSGVSSSNPMICYLYFHSVMKL